MLIGGRLGCSQRKTSIYIQDVARAQTGEGHTGLSALGVLCSCHWAVIMTEAAVLEEQSLWQLVLEMPGTMWGDQALLPGPVVLDTL